MATVCLPQAHKLQGKPFLYHLSQCPSFYVRFKGFRYFLYLFMRAVKGFARYEVWVNAAAAISFLTED